MRATGGQGRRAWQRIGHGEAADRWAALSGHQVHFAKKRKNLDRCKHGPKKIFTEEEKEKSLSCSSQAYGRFLQAYGYGRDLKKSRAHYQYSRSLRSGAQAGLRRLLLRCSSLTHSSRSSRVSGRGEHVHSVRAPVGRVERGGVHEEARREALRAGDAHELQQLELL